MRNAVAGEACEDGGGQNIHRPRIHLKKTVSSLQLNAALPQIVHPNRWQKGPEHRETFKQQGARMS